MSDGSPKTSRPSWTAWRIVFSPGAGVTPAPNAAEDAKLAVLRAAARARGPVLPPGVAAHRRVAFRHPVARLVDRTA